MKIVGIYQEGELNPSSKLTEASVKDIIELLLNAPLTYKETTKRYSIQLKKLITSRVRVKNEI